MDKALSLFDLDKLNSMTKYPSILTYHELGDKGVLKETLSEDKKFEDQEAIYITEKIDGTNGRIIIYENDYMIGSREDILFAKGDRIINNTLGIINSLKPYADKFCDHFNQFHNMLVFYFEVYGGNITHRFINYLKNIRKQAKISTRELGKAINKSAAYISLLENGKIKTIEYEIACSILQYIDTKRQDNTKELLEGNKQLLIGTFNIMPFEYTEKRNKENKEKKDRINKKIKQIGELG